MTKRQQVLALLALGWSFRRIERETGVRRETISGYARPADPNPAKMFPGSEAGWRPEIPQGASWSWTVQTRPKRSPARGQIRPKRSPAPHAPPRFAAAAYRDAILEKLELGLTVQRIYQDLRGGVRLRPQLRVGEALRAARSPDAAAGGVMHTILPGEEAQVDFFQGAPTLDAQDWAVASAMGVPDDAVPLAARLRGSGLGSEARDLPAPARERVSRASAASPRVVRHDNLKAAVVRACFYDPDVNPVYDGLLASTGASRHCRPGRGTRRRTGSRSAAAATSRATPSRGVASTPSTSRTQHLRHWNRTDRAAAHPRHHPTSGLHPLRGDRQEGAAAPRREPFAIFERGTRTVHPDGHVEVDGAFYPVPPHLLGQELEVRWDAHLVRVFHGEAAVAVHARVRPGEFARRAGVARQEPTLQPARLRREAARALRPRRARRSSSGPRPPTTSAASAPCG